MDKIIGPEEKLPVDNSLSHHPPGHHPAPADRQKAKDKGKNAYTNNSITMTGSYWIGFKAFIVC